MAAGGFLAHLAHDGRSVPCRVQDISPLGVGLLAAEPLEAPAEVALNLAMAGWTRPLTLHGRLVHSRERALHVQLHPPPPDAATLLSTLLRKLADPNAASTSSPRLRPVPDITLVGPAPPPLPLRAQTPAPALPPSGADDGSTASLVERALRNQLSQAATHLDTLARALAAERETSGELTRQLNLTRGQLATALRDVAQAQKDRDSAEAALERLCSQLAAR